MLLKEQHIAVFQANWCDKATNMKAIAETLNIGIDSLVLLDDNPAERAQVRDALPEVAVPELPEDPAFFAQTLLAAGYFESNAFTAEDRQRADQYQANAARAELLGVATDLESYLRSLEMKAIAGPFDSVARTRITQLINKTNQFNLTTRRYTESQVTALEESSQGLTLQIRLIDKFGDNGIVAIVICVPDGANWVIDTWLMSCRVLKRKLEEATLNCIVAAAKSAGVEALIGQYLRTERNEMVKEHYPRLGFAPLDANDGESRWRLDVGGTWRPACRSKLSGPVQRLPPRPGEIESISRIRQACSASAPAQTCCSIPTSSFSCSCRSSSSAISYSDASAAEPRCSFGWFLPR